MRYRERVLPGFWVYATAALILPAVMIVFWPIHPTVGIILAVVLFAGAVVALIASAPILSIDDQFLRVGSARIPLRFVGEATALTTRDAARAELGPKFDARAWTCIRGWVPTSVRVEINDDNDPIPYWLFSTRHPEAVVASLRAVRADANKSIR